MQDWHPHGYQLSSVKWLVSRGGAGLFLDPGLGKTAISLAAFIVLQKKGLARKALVIAPLRPCYSVWPVEVEKWNDFSHLKVVVLHGRKKNDLIYEDADIFVINPEGLKWLAEKVAAKQFVLPDTLFVDESTKFKHATTKRFKILKPMLNAFRRRYILTGTPAPNGLLDLFGQVYVIDQGAALGRFVTRFRNEFFVGTGYGGYTYVPQHDADERIQNKIAPLCLRFDDSVLDMPELVETDVMIDLPAKTRKTYAKLNRDFVADLKQGRVKAVNAAAKSTKLRQVASGTVYTETSDEAREKRATTKRTSEAVHDEKITATIDLLEELSGQPTLVSYEFEHERDRLIKALQKAGFGDVPYLGGGVSAGKGEKIIKEWNANQLPVLIVHPGSMAHGLNLQKAGRAVIFFSLTWNLEHYDQLIRRIYRQGQKAKRVFVYRMIATGTVDVTIARTLAGKDRTQKSLLDAMRHDAMELEATA